MAIDGLENKDRPELILASSSPYRRELMQRLGLPFVSLSPDIDESPRPGESPQQLVRRLARQKAEAVAASRPQAIVIGSDQVAVHGQRILGKAGNEAAARDQLKRLSGQCVDFLTSLCVLSDLPGQQHVLEHTDVTRVCFRPLSDAEITAYLKKDRAWDCAGSFKVESLGVCLFERVKSQDPTALQGLPLIRLCEFLRRTGVNPLTAA